MESREVRCPNPHPDFPKAKCGLKVLDGDFEGTVVVICRRCRNSVTITRLKEGTESFDKNLVTV